MQAASEEQKEMLLQKLAEKQKKLEELEAEHVLERQRKQGEVRASLTVAVPPKKILRPAWGEGGVMKCAKIVPRWNGALPRSGQRRKPASLSRLMLLASLSQDLQETVVSESSFKSDFDKLTSGLRNLASPCPPIPPPQDVIMIDVDDPISDERGEKRKASANLFTPSKMLKTSPEDFPQLPLLTSPLETPNKDALIQRPALLSPITPFLDQWRDARLSLKKRPRSNDDEERSEYDFDEAVNEIIAKLEAEEDQPSSADTPQGTSSQGGIRCCHVERVLEIMQAEERSKAARGDMEAKIDLSLTAALSILMLPSDFFPNASSEAIIKAKYRELCVVLHPDKNKHPQASDCFTALSMAADVVTARSRLPASGSNNFDPDADDPAFWVDEQGEIFVPRAAKVLNEESGPPGQDPRWSQALVLFNAPASVPMHVTSKSRLHKSALPVPLDMVKRLVGPKSASWPSSCPSYEAQDGKGMEGRVDLGSPYLLMFIKQQGDLPCAFMRPSEVEQALTTQDRGDSEVEDLGLHAMLLLPAWVTLQGSFPLNATYFQTNEVMMDNAYIKKPLLVPWDEILKLAIKSSLGDEEGSKKIQLPWKSLYFGFSAASICAKMGFAEVANLFHRSSLCVRAFDWENGSHVILPPFAIP